MKNKFLAVVSCYTTKRASTTLSFTSAEIETANIRTELASTTAAGIANYEPGALVNKISADSNLEKIQTITRDTKSASSVQDVQDQNNNLTLLTPTLHTADQVNLAKNDYASTTSKISENSGLAQTMTDDCAAFPTR